MIEDKLLSLYHNPTALKCEGTNSSRPYGTQILWNIFSKKKKMVFTNLYTSKPISRWTDTVSLHFQLL